MIVGVGVDVLDVSRMESELQRDAGEFRARIFTPGEIAHCDAHRHPARHFAARFAAKEALIKALRPGSTDGATWREVEVCAGEAGAPELRLHGRLRDLAARRHVRSMSVSLAHERNVAVAVVVLDREPPAPGEPTPEGERS